MQKQIKSVEQSELGKRSDYVSNYDPDKLFAIPRKSKRDEINVPHPLPFTGYDIWNHYEVSWLNSKGKPMVAMAEIMYPCESENIIESKSMKLYFNSLNNSRFNSMESLAEVISQDISDRINAKSKVVLRSLYESDSGIHQPEGENIDDLDIHVEGFELNPAILKTEDHDVSEVLSSDLLKSNCLVTGQPDWASVIIQYKGKKINHESLLRYIVSFRNHNEFHEQCVERMFMDISRQCQPEELTVYARYTRRGGLDINPVRTSLKNTFKTGNLRLIRQ